MKENNKVIRDKWLHLRLTAEEQQQIKNKHAKSAEGGLCTYARKILLGEPVVLYYRNRSLDSLITEFTALNKTLNGIANNFNQSVHKLHMLDHVPQIRAWLTEQQNLPLTLLESIEQAKVLMQKVMENGSRH